MSVTSLLALEITASALAFIYLVLASWQQRACWIFSIVSALLFVPIFWSEQLYLYTALQFYFVGASIYGWFNWSGDRASESALPVRRLSTRALLTILGAIAGFSSIAIAAQILPQTQDEWALWPGALQISMDAVSSCASIIAMVLTTRKYLQSWLLWLFLVNLPLSVYCTIAELYPTALLYMTYAVMSVFGYFKWRRSL